ncbi:hypothetical protein LTR28_004879, partial [Elasticomyces elasticus]
RRKLRKLPSLSFLALGHLVNNARPFANAAQGTLRQTDVAYLIRPNPKHRPRNVRSRTQRVTRHAQLVQDRACTAFQSELISAPDAATRAISNGTARRRTRQTLTTGPVPDLQSQATLAPDADGKIIGFVSVPVMWLGWAERRGAADVREGISRAETARKHRLNPPSLGVTAYTDTGTLLTASPADPAKPSAFSGNSLSFRNENLLAPWELVTEEEDEDEEE